MNLLDRKCLAGYVRWHLLRLFFEDLTRWREEAAPLAGLDSALTQERYDQLFKGTCADIYIPLWASACIGGEDILLNEVTLEVIQYYKKYGYAWAAMDGNPPDFIGQQCRFLEYLAVSRLHGGGADLEGAAEEFLQKFFIDTAHAVSLALEREEQGADASLVLRLLREAIEGREDEGLLARGGWEDFDSWSWRRGKEIPLEPERTVSLASFCDCGNKCKMLARVQEGCVLSISPDRTVPGKDFPGCPRGRAYRQTFLTSRRLRYPMVRAGERGSGVFRRISWDEAARMAAEGIRRAGEKYGPGARYVPSASGVSALVRGDRFVKHLLSLEGGYLDYYNTYSVGCALLTLPYIYGTSVCGSPEADLLNTKLLLLWGHNPASTHWGGGQQQVLVQLKQQGVPIIVIDPRRSDTAKLFADQWIPIRPGTDGALADAMAYVIWSEGLQDQAFMDRFCLGFDEAHMPQGVPAGESYHSYLFGKKDGVLKTPEWAEAICGVPAETIRDLAERFARTKPACLLPGLGPQRTLNGEPNVRSCAMLACLTGNVGVPGGGTGAYATRHGHLSPYFAPRENPYPGSIATFQWTRAIDAPETLSASNGLRGVERLETGVKVIFNLASGILLNQHSNINDTIRILKAPDKLELLVVSDLFMTPGARFADLLLPGVSFFEVENVVPPWMESDYLLYNQQAIEPVFGAQFEYEWIRKMAAYLGHGEDFTLGRRELADWIRALYEEGRQREPELPDFETFRARGCHVYRSNRPYVAFQENVEAGTPFDTPSGKIEIFSKRLYDMGRPEEIPAIPRYVPCEEGVADPLRETYPLQLIGYHTKRRCHSIHDQNRLLEALDPPAVWMHPADAAARGIREGDLVEIFNARGTVRVPARVTEDIVEGAAALSEGGWYTPDKTGVDTRGSINVLTMSHRATPLTSGNPQHTNLVEIRRAASQT